MSQGAESTILRRSVGWVLLGAWLAVFLALGLAGCAPTYVGMSLTGYQDQTRSLPGAGASIHVRPNQDPANPLLDQEVGRKITAWLSGKGYPVAVLEEADLVLTYAYGLDHGETAVRTSSRPQVYTDVAIVAGSGFHSHGGVGIGFSFGPGYTGYYGQPLIRHWLEIRVLDGPAFRSGGQAPVVWAGDAETFGEDRNLRGVLDYLIVGTLRSLWQDTGQAVRVVVPRNDPALEEIRGPAK